MKTRWLQAIGKLRLVVLVGLASCSTTGPVADRTSSDTSQPSSPKDGAVAVEVVDAAMSGDAAGMRPSATPSAREVFTTETRDESFAGPREELLNRVFDGVRKRISSSITLLATCRTTSCLIQVRGLSKDRANQTRSDLQSIPWGDRITVSKETVDGEEVMSIYSVLDGPMAAIQVQADYMRKQRLLD